MGSDTGTKVTALFLILIAIVVGITFLVVIGNVIGGQINAIEATNSSQLNQTDTVLNCAESNVTLNCSTFVRFGQIIFITNNSINLSTTDYRVNTSGSLCLENSTFNGSSLSSDYLCETDEFVNSSIIRLLAGIIAVVVALLIIVAIVIALVKASRD